jgi:hypothetical protein
MTGCPSWVMKKILGAREGVAASVARRDDSRMILTPVEQVAVRASFSGVLQSPAVAAGPCLLMRWRDDRRPGRWRRGRGMGDSAIPWGQATAGRRWRMPGTGEGATGEAGGFAQLTVGTRDDGRRGRGWRILTDQREGAVTEAGGSHNRQWLAGTTELWPGITPRLMARAIEIGCSTWV